MPQPLILLRLRKAGELGFEPRQADPESAVLPLHHSPLGRSVIGEGAARATAFAMPRPPISRDYNFGPTGRQGLAETRPLSLDELSRPPGWTRLYWGDGGLVG